MSTLKNSHIRYKLNFSAFTNIVSFIILSWICLYHNDKNTSSKSLENGRKIDKSLDIRAYRLLAKYGDKSELQRTKLQNRAYNDSYNHKLKNEKGNNNTYKHLIHDKLDNMDTYLKSYKSRYANKKGLKKFDCLCEKKVFDKFDYIDELAKKLKNNKKSFIKIIFNKYFLRFFLFSLLPFIGIIIPVLLGGKHGESLIKWCDKSPTTCKNSGKCEKGYTYIDPDVLNGFHNFINAISYTLIILSFIMMVYTFIKAIKYERIKSGKSKINIKKY